MTNPLPGVPLVESPFFDRFFNEDTDPQTLEIARNLRKDGYAIFQFPDKQFDKRAQRIKKELKPLYDWDAHKANPKGGLRVQDAWKFNADVKSLATNQHILLLLEELYGRKPIPFQTLNFPVGTQQHLHSDSIHFSCIPERFMCGVWIALEDIEDDAGPLQYCPGTHTWPIYTNEHIGRSHKVDDKPSQVVFHEAWQALVEESKVETRTFKAKKGDALIWAANLLHGGSPQLNLDKTRWSQVTHYYFEDCVYYTPLLSETYKGIIHYRDIVNITTGESVCNKSNGHIVDRAFIEQCRTGLNSKLIPAYDFDAEQYILDNPDVAGSKEDPYEHYRLHGFFEKRKARTLTYKKKLIPENMFDKKAYLAANKDVATSGVDAYEHYLSHGIDENRPLCL